MNLNTWNDYHYFTFLNHFIHFRHSNLPTINILVILFLEHIIASCSELILLHSYVIAPYSFSTQFRMHIKTCQNDYISIALRFFDQPSVIFLALAMWNICQTFVMLFCDIRIAVLLYIPCDIIFLFLLLNSIRNDRI